VPGTPVIFLVLVAAFTALLLVYLSWTQRKVFNFQRIGLIALGVISLGIIFWQFNSLQNDVASQSFSTIQVSYLLGFWGEIFGFLAVIVGGGFIIQEFSQMSFLNSQNGLSEVGGTSGRASSNLPVTNERPYANIPPDNGVGNGKQESSSSMEFSQTHSSTPTEPEVQRTAVLVKKRKGRKNRCLLRKLISNNVYIYIIQEYTEVYHVL
jgi:hypothetical protein